MSLTRRAFGATFLSSLAACSVPDKQQAFIMEACRHNPQGPLTIDMHCHIINSRDINAQAFVNRRVLNTDEGSVLADLGAGLLVGGLLVPFELFTQTSDAEAKELKALHKMIMDDENTARRAQGFEEFCAYTSKEQKGFTFTDTDALRGGDGSRVTGFFSNRARNAALMVALWPDVDIFMPSMVDLYDVSELNDSNQTEAPEKQAEFYAQLNLATRGRFLPMVSFSPQRAWIESCKACRSYDPLELVKDCILNKGFVGVKLHPSSGFDPHDNHTHGCSNTALQSSDLSPKEADHLNKTLRELYRFCLDNDVPIMTHGSGSRAANRSCMRNPEKPPVEWTNSPLQWSRAVEECPGLKVVLAHFASGFLDHGEGQAWCNYDENDALKPSDWLVEAMKAMQTSHGRNICIDISDMTFLAESYLNRDNPLGGGCGENGKYAEKFGEFMATTQAEWNGQFHRRLLYGSDYHMPSVARVGRRYLEAIMGAIPYAPEEKADILGRNTVELYGLQEGGTGRRRLIDFYARHGLNRQDIPWIRRVDESVAI